MSWFKSVVAVVATAFGLAVQASTDVAKIGDTPYSTLAAAFGAAKANDKIEILVANTYTLASTIPANVTVEGAVDGVVFDCVGTGSIANTSGVTFKNVTFKMGTADYHGFYDPNPVVMDGCTINGKFFSYGEMAFTNCTFKQTAVDYCMWVYNSNTTPYGVTYVGCTFDTFGKALHVYNEGGKSVCNLTVENCTFKNSGDLKKPGVLVKSISGNNTETYYNVNIVGEQTLVGGWPSEASPYADGGVKTNGVWDVEGAGTKVVVSQDGEPAWKDGKPVEPVANVAQVTVGGVTTKYSDLLAALTAAKTAGAVCELLSDVDLTGVEWTPVANFQGVFDGKGYTISGLTVNTDDGAALIAGTGSVDEDVLVTVKNVTIQSPSITGKKNTGVVFGTGFRAMVSNVTVVAATVNGTKYVGGIAGCNYCDILDSTIINSTVSGVDQVGGMIGYICGSSIVGCVATNNTITATEERAGGLAGKLSVVGVSYFNDNLVSGTATCAADKACGIAGQIMGADDDDPADPTTYVYYEIKNNTIDIELNGKEVCPVGVLRDDSLDSFKTNLAANVTGNTWTAQTYPENSYTYTYTTTGDVPGQQTIWNGEPKAYIAQVTVGGVTTKYSDLHAALTAAKTAGAVCELLSDVDLTGVAWTPVSGFAGTFDGKGFAVSGLTVSGAGYVGLFSSLNGATVKDLTISGANVTATGNKSGILAAEVASGAITNVKVINSTISSSGEYVGALFGIGYTAASVCEIAGCTISGSEQVGGAIGYMWVGSIEDCTVTNNTVTASSRAGGLIGKVQFAKDNIGPVLTDKMWINGNTVDGTVDGGDMAGGLAGQIMGDDARYEIKNNAIDVALTGTAKNPIGILRNSQNAAFTGSLEKNITDNTWTKTTLDADSFQYTNVASGVAPQTIWNGEPPAAKIGDTPYSTLEAAAEAATEGQTVELLRNVDLTAYAIDEKRAISFADDVTVDLKGFKISSQNAGVTYAGNGLVLTNGTFELVGAGSYALCIGDRAGGTARTGTTLCGLSCIGGVNVYKTSGVVLSEVITTETAQQGYHAVYAGSGTDITIKSGSYKTKAEEGGSILYAYADDGNSIVVEGGTFVEDYDYIVVSYSTGVILKGGTFNQDPTKWVADGYEVKANTPSAGLWTVAEMPGFYQDKADANLWHVRNLAGLLEFRDSVNASAQAETYLGQTVRLDADIDLSSVTAWTPIGINTNHKFDGTFDGAGHTISNLNAEVTGGGNGFFGILDGTVMPGVTAVVCNVTFDNVRIVSVETNTAGRIKGNMYGVVAAYAYSDVRFENVTLRNCEAKAYAKVGAVLGMAADAFGTTTFKDCTVENTKVQGTYNCATYCGLCQNKMVMEGCTGVAAFTQNSLIDPPDTNWEALDAVLPGYAGTYCVNERNGWYCAAWADRYIELAPGKSAQAYGAEFCNGIHYAAYIGEDNYATLEAAIAGAKANDVIVLVTDNSETFTMTTTVPFSINRNGKNLTGSVTPAAGYEFVINDDGTCSYQHKVAVAQIGSTPYYSINEAFAAVEGQADDDVTIKILRDIAEDMTADYTFSKGLTITTDVEGGVTVDLGFEYGKSLWGLVENGGRTLTIDENVTITGLGQLFSGYGTAGNVVDICGDMTAQQLWAFKGGIVNILPTAKVVTAYGDGMVKMRRDCAINVEGLGQDEVQFEAGYITGDFDGDKTLSLTNTSVTSAWLVNEGNGTFTLNLVNAKLVLSHEASNGLNLGASSANTINMTVDSLIVADTIANVGTINIDATGIAGSAKVIDYTGTGTMTLADYAKEINVTGGEAKVIDNDLYICEIVWTGDESEAIVIVEKQTASVDTNATAQVVSDPEVAEKIEQNTTVTGVKLASTNEEVVVSGAQSVVLVAKATGTPEFQSNIENGTNITIKVDVEVKPTVYVAPAEEVKDGTIEFNLVPMATVTIDEGGEGKTNVVAVTNEMIDQLQDIKVTVYTGFKPEQAVHTATDGSVIQAFAADEISYDPETGNSTVIIHHFSNLSFKQTEQAAKIGDTYYATLQAAFDAAADGETIALLKDVVLDSRIAVTNAVTLDIGEYDVTATNALTGTTKDTLFVVKYGADFTVEGTTGTIGAPEVPSITSAIKMTEKDDVFDGTKRAKLTVNANLTGYYYAITGNGNRSGTDIVIDGGTITAVADKDNLAIFNPQTDSTVTVNGGSLTGYASAIEMRGGALVVNGGTLTATAPTYAISASGSGNTTTGAAIAVAQHTTKGDISVTINGGTINGVRAFNEADPQGNEPENVTVDIKGGTFTGDVAAEDATKYISGGSFSGEIAQDQCKDWFAPKYDPTTGTWGVKTQVVFITDVKAGTRYPWNGLVDVTFTLKAQNAVRLFVAAYDAEGERLSMTAAKLVTNDGEESIDVSTGFTGAATGTTPAEFHVVWDSVEAAPNAKVDGVTFKVFAK